MEADTEPTVSFSDILYESTKYYLKECPNVFKVQISRNNLRI
jgi:hypothetical protein